MIKRIRPYSFTKLNICDFSILNSNECPEENIIYIFKDYDNSYEYWKVNLNFFNKLDLLAAYSYCTYFCDNKTHFNDNDFVILRFKNNSDDDSRSLFVLTLIYHKYQFKFDYDILQNLFDNLSKNEQNNITQDLKQFNYDILKRLKLNFEKYSDELSEFYIENTNLFTEINSKLLTMSFEKRCDEVDAFCIRYREKLKEIQKKLDIKYKKRETKYRNQGCQILNGRQALDVIRENHEYSMIALDTDDWYSIEFNYNGYYCSDLPEVDHFTVRTIIGDKIKREVCWEALLNSRIYNCKWAIKKYHSGFFYH